MALHLDYSELNRIVLEAIIIVCFGVTIGLAFNYQLIMNVFEGEVVTSSPDVGESQSALLPVPISMSELQQLMPRSVIVDARITELYAAGHLPNAVSLPLADVENSLDSFLSKYPGRSLIIYCSGYGCTDSFDLALLLLKKGYHDVMIYEGGYPEWRDAGQPVEEGTP